MAKSAATIAKEQDAFAREQELLEMERASNTMRVVSDIEDVEHDEYAELFAGLGDDAQEKVLLYRIAPGSQKQGLLCRLDPGTSVEDIQPRFGGGDYVIKRLRSGMIIKSARLFVEGEPRTPPLPPEPSIAVGAGLDVAALIQGLQESNRQMLQGLVQVLQPAQNSEVQMLEKMAMYKQLFHQPQQQQNPMDMFIKGMEMAKEMTPRAAGETTGMDVVLEAVKGFAPAISDITQRLNAQAIPAAHIGPPAQMVPVANHIGPPAPQTEQGEETMLKMYLAMLVAHAKNGKDPVLYADLIADNMSDEQIMQLLNDPGLMNKLSAMNAGVSENLPWFNQLIIELKNIMDLTESQPAPIVIGNNPVAASSIPQSGSLKNANIGSTENAHGSTPDTDQ